MGVGLSVAKLSLTGAVQSDREDIDRSHQLLVKQSESLVKLTSVQIEVNARRNVSDCIPAPGWSFPYWRPIFRGQERP